MKTKVKLFTVDQAEKALPLVRRVVGDIVKNVGEYEKRMQERQALPEKPAAGTRAEDRALKLEGELENYVREIERFQKELKDIGVELKDYRSGLIDFYSRYNGRVVHLCWKLDEGDTLAWWHELDGGFRGRQPITPANRNRFRGNEG